MSSARRLLPIWLLAVVMAAPAGALQVPPPTTPPPTTPPHRNLSDVTGTMVTSGDVAPGLFNTVAAGGPVTFTTPAAAAAATAGVVQIQADLAAVALRLGGEASAGTGVVLDAGAQRRFADLLACSGSCAPLVVALATALTGDGAGAPPPEHGVRVAESLRGLALTARRGDAPSIAAGLTRAAAAFQALVEAAGAAYLAAPPAELDVAYALLRGAILAATGTSGYEDTP